jgi:hypothetical protein
MKNSYKRLWNASDGILEEFIMEIMPNIDDADPGELRIRKLKKRGMLSKRLLNNLHRLEKRS